MYTYKKTTFISSGGKTKTEEKVEKEVKKEVKKMLSDAKLMIQDFTTLLNDLEKEL